MAPLLLLLVILWVCWLPCSQVQDKAISRARKAFLSGLVCWGNPGSLSCCARREAVPSCASSAAFSPFEELRDASNTFALSPLLPLPCWHL